MLLNPNVLAGTGLARLLLYGGRPGAGCPAGRRLAREPRWLFTHGKPDEADQIVDDIERQVRESTGHELDDPGEPIKVRQRPPVSFIEVARVVFGSYPRRSSSGCHLFIGQAFLYNAVFFTYSLVLTTFYHVPSSSVGYYLIAFAVGNLLGPLILGRLFDVVGRRPMIAGTYLASGVMLAVTAWLFDQGVSRRHSNGGMGRYLLPGFGRGQRRLLDGQRDFPHGDPGSGHRLLLRRWYRPRGIIGPVLFGQLIATNRPSAVAVGYVIGGCPMAAAGLVEVFLGVDAEQQSLEDIASPLSAAEPEEGKGPGGRAGRGGRLTESGTADPTGPYPPPRATGSGGVVAVARRLLPRRDPYLAREVDAVVAARSDAAGVMSPLHLSRAVGADLGARAVPSPQCARRWRQVASAGSGPNHLARGVERWPGCRREGRDRRE